MVTETHPAHLHLSFTSVSTRVNKLHLSNKPFNTCIRSENQYFCYVNNDTKEFLLHLNILY